MFGYLYCCAVFILHLKGDKLPLVTILGDYIEKHKDGIFFKPLEDLNLVEDETLWHPIVMDLKLFEVFNKEALSCVFPYIVHKDWRRLRQYYNRSNFVPSFRSVLTRLNRYPSRIYVMGGPKLYKDVLKMPIRIHYQILMDRFYPSLVPKHLELKAFKEQGCYDTMYLISR